MLAPDDRRLLLDSLAPPDGYRLDQGVGTTFSLDLVALLRVPLAFTVFDWQQTDGSPTADPHALLAALRQYADRLTVFCQAGQISVPRHDHRLLSQLEDAIVEAKSPTEGGVFHPKVWALRYIAPEDPVRYRLLVLSRNLTFDRSWDAALVLDGELTDRTRRIASSRPAADFVASLEDCAITRLSATASARVRMIAHDLARVRWELPEHFEQLVFHPIGHDGQPAWPFSGDIRRMLVISPFARKRALKRLAQHGAGHRLVSRLETLAGLTRDELASFDPIEILDDALQPDDLDEASTLMGQVADDEAALDPTTEVTGLHAKLYVADAGWKSRLWIGSANATDAAFERNVEFLAELQGPKGHCGIDAVLGDPQADRSLSSLLRRFDPPADRVPVDSVLEELERELERLRRRIAGVQTVAEVGPDDDDRHRLTLRLPPAAALPAQADALVRPITLTQTQAISESTTWRVVPTELLTPFFAFEVTLRSQGREASTAFLTRAELSGAPEGRREALLTALLRDRSQVLRFLLLLLADSSGSAEAALSALAAFRERAGDGDPSQQPSVPLLETMLKALDRDPRALEQVERLVADLSASDAGADLLPEGFSEVWQPIREAMIAS
jgi:hypothetical protein